MDKSENNFIVFFVYPRPIDYRLRFSYGDLDGLLLSFSYDGEGNDLSGQGVLFEVDEEVFGVGYSCVVDCCYDVAAEHYI